MLQHNLLPRYLMVLLFASFLLALPYVEVQAAPAQQQSATSYQGFVNSTANIRSGPGLDYAVVDQARDGQIVTVVACNEDCSWLQLDNGNWIAAFLVDLLVSPESSRGGRRGNGPINLEDVVIDEPSQAALEVVEQILSYTGLPQSFDVYSANIYNAAAAVVDGKRVILYDPQLITDIESVTNHNWPAVSILAHEIGHHLAGHTLAEEFMMNFELEADYFSGFILYKMGATLAEAQSVMSLLRDHPNMVNHPPQAQRLAAIEDGWREAARQSGLTVNIPITRGSNIFSQADSADINYSQAENERKRVTFVVADTSIESVISDIAASAYIPTSTLSIPFLDNLIDLHSKDWYLSRCDIPE